MSLDHTRHVASVPGGAAHELLDPGGAFGAALAQRFVRKAPKQPAAGSTAPRRFRVYGLEQFVRKRDHDLGHTGEYTRYCLGALRAVRP